MRILLAVVCTALLGACAAAPVDSDEARRALTAQADAWDKALIAKDRAGIEANMAPEFRQLRSGGKIVGREEFINDVLDPGFSMEPYTVEDFEIRFFGDTALVYGRIRMSGRDGAERWSAHFRYIDTYVRRAGQWKVVSVQITPLPK
jgi:ketosteroid isomerase-like protein